MENNLWNKKIDRRELLKFSAGAAATLAVGSLLPSKVFARAAVNSTEKITLADCLKMTPEQMAEKSTMTKNGYAYLLKRVKDVSDDNVRQIALEGLKSPKPKLMELYTAGSRCEMARRQLVDAGYIKNENTCEQILPPCKGSDICVQSFFASPGSGWKSHHAYPGGLVSHVATDMQIALGAYDSYEKIYGYEMNKELIVSAILLHDVQKPWVLQWQKDNACMPETNIAGTGAHHILAIADAIYRRLSPELVVAIACSHDHPGFPSDEEQVVNWIKAAGILANSDPVKYGLIAADGKTLPLPRRQEGFLVHLGDHDYVLTAPVSKWLSEKLRELVQKQYKMTDEDINGKPFNTLRNYLYSQMSDMQLYQLWVEKGEKALGAMVATIVTP